MRYIECLPAPDLRPLADRYWRLTAHVPRGVERALPDAHCEIVVQLAAPCARIEDTGAESIQPRSLFIGQMTRPVALRPLGAMDVFGIRFRPQAAPHRLPNSMLAMDEIYGKAAAAWEDHLRTLTHTTDMAGATDKFLRNWVLPAHQPDQRVTAAVRRLREGIPVARVAEEVELGRRQFERRFQSRVGLTPKMFARISRFQRALSLQREQPGFTWAQRALECGYFDQAHLALDFREFAGQPPTVQEAASGAMERSLASRDAFP